MKPSTHRAVTSLAVELYERFHPNTPLTGSLQEKRPRVAVLDGSEDEDNKTIPRALNWHFFPANPILAGQSRSILSLVTLKPTSERIFSIRVEKLKERLADWPSRPLFKTFGRILHHIQDMSTPSHVVPVYHGINIKDEFESYLEKYWETIDNELRTYRFDPTGDQDTKGCSDFSALYLASGSRLLRTLQPGQGLFPLLMDTTRPAVPSTAFWKPHEMEAGTEGIPCDIQGFGNFGELDPKFGRLGRFKLDGMDYALDTDEDPYLKIAVFYMKSAVQDSITALGIFEKMYR